LDLPNILHPVLLNKNKGKKLEAKEEVEDPVPVAPVVEEVKPAEKEETEEPFVYKVVKALPTQQVRSVMGDDGVLVKIYHNRRSTRNCS